MNIQVVYGISAFFVTLVIMYLYNSYVYKQDCEQKKFQDHVFAGLPFALVISFMVYLLSPKTASTPMMNLAPNAGTPPMNLGSIPPNNGRGPSTVNMRRPNNVPNFPQ